jgi:hypothetical protein
LVPGNNDYEVRRSHCSTVAIPALVTCTDTGLESSIGDTSAPLDKTSNRCWTCVRQDVLGRADLHDGVAEPHDIRCSANGLDTMLYLTERHRIPTR